MRVVVNLLSDVVRTILDLIHVPSANKTIEHLPVFTVVDKTFDKGLVLFFCPYFKRRTFPDAGNFMVLIFHPVYKTRLSSEKLISIVFFVHVLIDLFEQVLLVASNLVSVSGSNMLLHLFPRISVKLVCLYE